MALPIEQDLQTAWQSLAGSAADEGWQVIGLGGHGGTPVHAGRHFPGNLEGLLLVFQGARLPGVQNLPRGHGFEVTPVRLGGALQDRTILALVREPAGSLEMFVTMAADLLAVLGRSEALTIQERSQAFLRRVATWQEFMRNPSGEILSAEAELGLIGELLTLELLLDAGVPATVAIDSWEGPADGLHDFVLGGGAIEVKSSAAGGGFIARIGSLDQLDDAVHAPLFLCCQRFSLDDAGETLFGHIDRLRTRLANSGAMQTFAVRLLHAGAHERHRDAYTRKLSLTSTNLFAVDDNIPRLTPSVVGPAIRRASYELDIDLVEATTLGLHEVLSKLDNN